MFRFPGNGFIHFYQTSCNTGHRFFGGMLRRQFMKIDTSAKIKDDPDRRSDAGS